MDSFEAFNQVQGHLLTLAQAHVERVLLEQFQQGVAQVQDPALQAVLRRLCDLYGLSRVEAADGWLQEHDFLEDAKARDPIVAYEQLLKERGWIDDAAIERMHDEVKAEVEDSIAFAEASEQTPAEALYQDVTVAHHIPQE